MKKIALSVMVVAAMMGLKAEDLQANPVPAIGQNAQNQTAFDATKKGPRVLFVGNSITLHGPRPQIGWTNNWGMAATARDKDYVHLLQKKMILRQMENLIRLILLLFIRIVLFLLNLFSKDDNS